MMKVSIVFAFSCLLAYVIGTGDRGAYERMLLYNAYIAEEFYKPGEFTIAPDCKGSRPGERCTFLEMLRHVWVATKGGQQEMPGAGKPPILVGDPPPYDETDSKTKKSSLSARNKFFLPKSNWYKANLGQFYFTNDNKEIFREGLSPDQDGQNFAKIWSQKPHSLQQLVVASSWDRWMEIGKMAAGASRYEHTFAKMGDAISASRMHLLTQTPSLSAQQSALFDMAESVGSTIRNLRDQDTEKYRSGDRTVDGKTKERTGPVNQPSDLAQRLLATPEFQQLQLTLEEKGNLIAVKKSGIVPIPKPAASTEWLVFDNIETAKRWKTKIPNVEEVITRVCDAYKLEPIPKEHYIQIAAIEEANRKIKSSIPATLGACAT
ncbi:hypothetical protein HYFRA_00009108 [Hymenoscyphus fraxineus]|uniref:Uncharacterized protein n=1 Tax=Hymenoscyphus fraxineus TaxID=746836 RepID=A0A9N9KV20_9HELO|nr:hypothetical protein HYFRA_00009108 [Hymenoscyphus fraxineus]